MTIGDNIKRIRGTVHISQNELAQRAGISKSQLSRIESGDQNNPQIQTLIAVSTALGASLDDIIYGEAPENINYLMRSIENLKEEEKKIAQKMLMGWILACQADRMKQ